MRRKSRRIQVAEWLEMRAPGRLGLTDLQEAGAALPGIPAKDLRRLLRDSGHPCDPLVEGVRQSSLDELERTLVSLSGDYQHHPTLARALVIEAKDHAKFALRRLTGEARAERERMVEWMLIWLENPPLFPVWNTARRTRLSS